MVMFLISVTIIPIVLVFFTSIISGARIRTMGMTPFYLFMGVFRQVYFSITVESAWFAQIVMSLGAGIYEEIIFRLLLITFFVKIIQIKKSLIDFTNNIIKRTPELFLDFDKSFKFGNQSLIVVDAKAFTEELKVDIAAERTPATTKPLKPTGAGAVSYTHPTLPTILLV